MVLQYEELHPSLSYYTIGMHRERRMFNSNQTYLSIEIRKKSYIDEHLISNNPHTCFIVLYQLE